jgi:hypothetical protein
VADKLALVTDREGAASFTIKDLPPSPAPATWWPKSASTTPTARCRPSSTTVRLWPSAVVLGREGRGLGQQPRQAKFTVLALDTQGKPIKGQAVEVRGRLTQIVSTRKRMVGGFYAYDNRTEVKDLGTLCSGSTDERACCCARPRSMPPARWNWCPARRTAPAVAQAATSVWVTRQGELWFEQDNDDRIDVLPEKKRYEPGETARLQVRMPFREATALVAVEREGVIDARGHLRGDDPSIEVKIDKAWAPNVYVSVLALRGRIREVPWYSASSAGAGRRRSSGRAPSGTKGASTRRRRRWSTSPSPRSSSAWRAAGGPGRARAAGGGDARQAAVRCAPEGAGDGQGDAGRQAPGRRRSGLCRGRRRPAGAARQRLVEPAVGADPQRAWGVQTSHRAERDHRPPPLRPQGRGRGRRRRQGRHARAVRHLAAVAAQVAARRQRRGDDRGAH